MQLTDKSMLVTVEEKTLLTSFLMDGFWDRWIAHGVCEDELREIRPKLKSVESWVESWGDLANKREKSADLLCEKALYRDAEWNYRIASLYYNIAQWIFSSDLSAKETWYTKCQETVQKADQISPIRTKYVRLNIGDHFVEGRIRIPANPKGCIIMMVPLDSNKEELMKYENDFSDAGYVTVNFDGPGQGGSYIYSGWQASAKCCGSFVDHLIEYICGEYPSLDIHIFGTSSGASWAIYGGEHVNIKKVVAVSPAMNSNMEKLPLYFKDRMLKVTLDGQPPLPVFKSPIEMPVLLFHGKQDVMTNDAAIDQLCEQLPNRKLIEFEEEGHCCNFKLDEIRRQAIEWFGRNAG